MTEITLSEDQQKAHGAFLQFLANPSDQVFVLEGYSGTGKSTLVSKILGDLPKLEKTLSLLSPGSNFNYEVVLTATTNKAAETLGHMLRRPVRTIHSVLKLRVQTDYKTSKSRVIPTTREKLTKTLLVVDEASYMDDELLKHTLGGVDRTCKVMLIGDPAQLKQVDAEDTPAFNKGFTTAKLERVVRQASGNPIIDLSTMFRRAVSDGEWSRFTPDNHAVQHLPREQFEAAIAQDFTNPNWKHDDSKVLAWTNKTVIAYNHGINSLVAGQPDFKIDDYAIVNSFIRNRDYSFKTDQTVQLTDISKPCENHGAVGRWYTLNNQASFFMPDKPEYKVTALAEARARKDMTTCQEILDRWVDLRAAYASTINKSQGSTYDRVYIDLDDLRKCRDKDQLARLLYVGTSRARHQAFFTGDL